MEAEQRGVTSAQGGVEYTRKVHPRISALALEGKEVDRDIHSVKKQASYRNVDPIELNTCSNSGSVLTDDVSSVSMPREIQRERSTSITSAPDQRKELMWPPPGLSDHSTDHAATSYVAAHVPQSDKDHNVVRRARSARVKVVAPTLRQPGSRQRRVSTLASAGDVLVPWVPPGSNLARYPPYAPKYAPSKALKANEVKASVPLAQAAYQFAPVRNRRPKSVPGPLAFFVSKAVVQPKPSKPLRKPNRDNADLPVERVSRRSLPLATKPNLRQQLEAVPRPNPRRDHVPSMSAVPKPPIVSTDLVSHVRADSSCNWAAASGSTCAEPGETSHVSSIRRRVRKLFKRVQRKHHTPMALGFFKKSPADLVKLAKAAILEGTNDEKGLAELSKRTSSMKTILYGQDDKTPREEKCVALSEAWQHEELLDAIVDHFQSIDFEIRKDFASCFEALVRRNYGGFRSDYLPGKTDKLVELSRFYRIADSALACGTILRECIHSQEVHKVLLAGPPADPTNHLSPCLILLFRTVVHDENFEVAADGFATINELLTQHKPLVHSFIEKNHEAFFEAYHDMLRSKVYTTRRQSLKLLSELLLDCDHFDIMIKYVSNPEYLKLIMTMLRDVRQNIQFEAFHVFKVFVANPHKPPVIGGILYNNREKLVNYLREFQNDRNDSEFTEEKALLIDTLNNRLTPTDGSKPVDSATNPDTQGNDQTK